MHPLMGRTAYRASESHLARSVVREESCAENILRGTCHRSGARVRADKSSSERALSAGSEKRQKICRKAHKGVGLFTLKDTGQFGIVNITSNIQWYGAKIFYCFCYEIAETVGP